MAVNQNKAIILDDLIPLDISSINRLRRLKKAPNAFHGVNISYVDPMTGEKQLVAQLSIKINLNQNYIDVIYRTGSSSGPQRIELFAKPGPIGKGFVHYFKCPANGSSRRKLFLFQGRFVSKAAIRGACYRSQIQSKKQRQTIKPVKTLIKDQKVVQQVEKRYFKKYYKANFTKKYLKVIDVTENMKTNAAYI